MTTRRDTPEALDAFVEALHRGTDAPVAIDPATARAARDLHALAAASGPRPGFLDALERRLLDTPVAPPVPLRRHRNVRRLLLAPLAAALVLAVGLAAASWASPVVWARVERLACFVPGLGIRACDAPGLIARQPTSVGRGATTLTVTHLLSGGGETSVKLEITGLPASPGDAARGTRVRLRDPAGREYAAWRGMQSGGAYRPSESTGPTTFHADWTFEPLDRTVRAVDVLLEAPEPVGSWQVRVPLVPTADTGLTAAGEGGPPVTIGGVTLRVSSVAADAERTALEVVGSAAPPARFVRGIGGIRFQRRVVLRDDRGREQAEVRSQGRTWSDVGGVYTDDMLFPPLPADARAAELVVPFVVVEEETANAELVVPIAGRAVGERIPLDGEVPLGPYRLRATAAVLLDQQNERWVAIDVAPSAPVGGRRLLAPAGLFAGGDGRMNRSTNDEGLVTRVAAPLGHDPGPEVRLVMRGATVAVDGPWRLPVRLPARP
ncbi:MAG TPA: hypothetical protein VG370_26385 [Chloroflexota bacterium]|jgi:hypothetical protein|nr:hypothetical protein [Chloroflexota bacterium]